MSDHEDPVPDSVIGPPKPSRADFYLPQRGAKSLDAAQVTINHPPAPPATSNGSASGAAAPQPAGRRR
jgi:hypothetical protein